MRTYSRIVGRLGLHVFTSGAVTLFAACLLSSPAAASLPVRITASDIAPDDNFGEAVAIDSDTLIVGSPNDDDSGLSSGAAYIYRWNGAGWTEEAKLVASDGAAGDEFGSAVAISRDTVIVGSPNDDDAGSNSGSAYIFVRVGSTWTQQAKLVASDGSGNDLFGTAVAIDGNTVIVGSVLDNDAGVSSGSAYVFVRSGSIWTQQAKLLASDRAAGDQFGFAVAIDGESAAVGARLDDDSGSNSGSAYVFVRNESSWTQQAKLLAGDGASGDEFGRRLAISSDTVVVGSWFDDDAGSSSGSAYVFFRSASTWSEQAKLVASDGAASDQFGVSVGIDNNTIVVGSSFDDDAGGQSGSAYVFVRNGSTWTQQAKLLAIDGAANDNFGVAVAIDADTAVFGATGGEFATVIQRIGPVWIGPDQKIVAADGAANDNFGESVAIDGDTAIVGARGDADAGPFSGSAYVFVRNGSTWTQQAKLLASDSAPLDQFGDDVAICGDTVVVGAPREDVGSVDSAWVFVRNGSTWTEQARLIANDGGLFDDFGSAVAISGDTIIVGSPQNDDSGSGSGSAYVFVRNGSTWTQQAKLRASDGVAGDNFGNSVAIDGDTAVVGSRLDDDSGTNSGSAYVFVRSGSTWTQEAKLLAIDGAASDDFGSTVAVDGDTAIVGSRFDDDAGLSSGSVYVFVRNGSTWAQQAKLLASDDAAGDLFGSSVAIDGDTAIIGAQGNQDAGANSGSAYVFVRSGSSWTEKAKFFASDGAAFDSFGTAVGISGDSAIVGSPFDDDAGTNSGSAWLYSIVPERFPALVVNESRGTLHPTFSGAFGVAGPFNQLIASPAAFWAEPAIDNALTPYFIESLGSIRVPFGVSLTLAPNTLMIAAPDRRIDLFGPATVRTNASLLSGSSLLIQNTLELQGGLLAALNGVSVRGELTGFGDIQADVTNASAVTVQANTQVIGDYTNNGTTTIQNGVLTVLGAIVDNGTIVGDFSTPRSSGGIFVEADYSAGAGSTLALVGGVARFGADFDVAINDNTRYDMATAELRMVGLSGSTQTLERMSVDIGANAAGFDRTIPAHYPIGTLRIGPTSTTVTIVDVHDNDGQGQGACEALYVRNLIIEPGATLITNGCPVYYETLTLNGSVDDPANLIRISNCPGDTNGDGVVNFADLNAVLASFGQSGMSIPGDVNGDGQVDFADLNLVLSNFGLPCAG